jgi:hypothetical protein
MAAAADDYLIVPGANEFIEVSRILMVMEDNAKFAGEKYTGAGALSTGIKITKENAAGVIHDYTPQPIKKIGHWGLLAGVDVVLTNFTTGNDIFIVRWTLSKADHKTTLDGRKGEFLQIEVNDTLVAAVSHLASAQGVTKWVG